MARGQTPALQPEVAERYRDVVRLKAAGYTFDQIAERVGYASRSGAKEAYDAAIRWWGREEVDSLRLIEGERLESMWRRLYARIGNDPDMPTDELVSLINMAVKVSARRSSLFGLDAPRQVELTGEDGGPITTDVGTILLERIQALAVDRGIQMPVIDRT
jgi:hypothetical protein